MKIRSLHIVVIALGTTTAYSQTPDGRRSFEVASIKLSPPAADGKLSISLGGDPGRLDWQGVPLKFMIAKAFEMNDFQISGPDWIGAQRFDLLAKLPEHATENQVPEMLRSLLEERFQLAAHKAIKEMPVYTLTVVKDGLRMKQVDDSSGQVRINPGRIQMRGASMSQLAALLARLLELPVLDQTGVTGNYNIRLEYVSESETASAGDASSPNLLHALEEQAGLKLQPKRAGVEQLIVDRIEKLPTAN